ncbi:MAG TPA: hypothetical protein PKI89_00060 [Tepidiformaceae bacterium]|nr:hypothetical protein [Tepidiformaceae bacterium]HNO66357.1 hypothetical protein [Tepidiformaceae bacterium]
MPDFPSVEWFKEAADLLNKSDSFKRLGTCDSEMGVQVGDRYFEVDFEAFEVSNVKEIDANRADELDFVLVQSPDAWKAMLDDIKANGRATHDYTLNSLDLRSEVEFARGKDYHRRDAFYRFNQTFQEFFDNSAKMQTTFPVTA